jgi:hypothetical protein
MSVPQDRRILLLGEPRVEPAILFWGVVIALALIAEMQIAAYDAAAFADCPRPARQLS